MNQRHTHLLTPPNTHIFYGTIFDRCDYNSVDCNYNYEICTKNLT